MLRIIKIAAVGLALGFTATSALKADTFNFTVDLNVASLIGTSGSPYYVDLQLNQGSGSLFNSATISNIVTTGGSFTGSATTNGSGATGSFGSSISLTESSSSAFNEIFQQIGAGVTDIKFDVSVTQNSPGATPDGFFVSVLDNTTGQIFTSAPDTLNLLELNINGHNTLGDVQTYTSTDPSPLGVTATATLTAVPEVASAPVLAAALGLLLALRRQRMRLA